MADLWRTENCPFFISKEPVQVISVGAKELSTGCIRNLENHGNGQPKLDIISGLVLGHS
jgi:hypothetical protein